MHLTNVTVWRSCFKPQSYTQTTDVDQFTFGHVFVYFISQINLSPVVKVQNKLSTLVVLLSAFIESLSPIYGTECLQQ